MISKHLKDITIEDLQALVDNAVPESRTLEYKREFPGRGDSDVIPLLKGISAFANTLSGDMLIGMTEANGVAAALGGVALDNPDAELRRIIQSVKTGLEPRFVDFDARWLKLENGNYVVICRAPKSWNAPHRVVAKGHDKFYGRNAAGSYPLDTTELRSAFLMSADIAARIQRFRTDRVAAVMADDELPVPLFPGGRLILHLIPLSAFTRSPTQVPINERAAGWPSPLGESGWNDRLNLDGIARYTNQRDGETSRSYSQLYRNGIVENVATLSPHEERGSFLANVWYEAQIITATKRYLKWAAQADVGFPVYALLSLVGMKGSFLGIDRGFFDSGAPLDRDPALFPDAAMEHATVDPATALKPIFDMVWNAYGYERSFNYDERNKWVGK